MLADIADEQRLLTGRRTEGALFGILSFGQQLATGAHYARGLVAGNTSFTFIPEPQRSALSNRTDRYGYSWVPVRTVWARCSIDASATN